MDFCSCRGGTTKTETRARAQGDAGFVRTVAMSFAAYLPAFLSHKAESALDREEAFHFARLLAASTDISDPQTKPALALAQRVLGNLLGALDDATEAVADAEARVQFAESGVPRGPVDETGVEDVENAGDFANLVAVSKKQVPSLDPSQCAAELAEAKALTSAAHAAIKLEIESRRVFANECAASVRAALDVNEQLEKSLDEANTRRKLAEGIAKQALKKGNELTRALLVKKAFDALREKTGRRRDNKNDDELENDGDEGDKILAEVTAELASAALACQRRRRGVLGRRHFVQTIHEIVEGDRREWAEEDNNALAMEGAATRVQSAFRGFAARRDIRVKNAAETENTRGEEDVHSLVQGILEKEIVHGLVQDMLKKVLDDEEHEWEADTATGDGVRNDTNAEIRALTPAIVENALARNVEL